MDFATCLRAVIYGNLVIFIQACHFQDTTHFAGNPQGPCLSFFPSAPCPSDEIGTASFLASPGVDVSFVAAAASPPCSHEKLTLATVL